jgi:hypothetical protein
VLMHEPVVKAEYSDQSAKVPFGRGHRYSKLCRCDGPLPIPMARLIFVNRYFFPDHSATIQILSDLTFHLAAAGHQVHVVASRQTAA